MLAAAGSLTRSAKRVEQNEPRSPKEESHPQNMAGVRLTELGVCRNSRGASARDHIRLRRIKKRLRHRLSLNTELYGANSAHC